MATTIADERNLGTAPPTTPNPRKRPIWQKLLLGFAVVICVLVVVIAMQPSDFRVSRSATMAAPQAAVFEQVNDFHKWDAWSPWVKLDPNAKITFEGQSTGVGSKFHWDGDSNVGAGSMTILKSEPNDHVHIKLDFIRPFAGTSDVHFALKPEGDGTNVTWSMEGKNNFIGKAIGLVIDCDKMIGDNYEKGLSNMKSIVEAEPKASPSGDST